MKIGSKWNGWTIEEVLGTGAFGTVYKVTKDEFTHHYESALKVISIPQSKSELSAIKSEGMNDESVTLYFQSMVEDITEELALMSRLKGNTNIVSYEDHIVNKKQDDFGWDIFARMELLTPLNDYVQTHSMKIRDVIQLGIDICQALEVCQKYNIIHRDIKPENIFVSDLGKFKLGDFGIARKLEKTVAAMSKKGTYTYMAPEVYKGLPYNSTVDIYSLGIVLYRFLNNNRTPFMPSYPNAIKYSDKEKANILRISGKIIPKPANAEGRLAEIVLKACSYDPDKRYESAVDFKQALQSVLYDKEEAEYIYKNGDNLSIEFTDKSVVDKDNIKNEQKEPTRFLFQGEAKKYAEKLAEEKAQKEAEKKAKREAEEKARKEAEKKAKREAEEKARKEAEKKAKREAEEKVRKEAEKKAKREAEEKARKEAEEKAKREAKEKAHKEAEERNKREAEEKVRREAKDKAAQDVKAKAVRKSKEDKKVKKNRNKIIALISSLAAVASIIVVVLIILNMSNKASVPNVVGLNMSKAETAIKNSGFISSISYQKSEKVDEDNVISQDVEAGSMLEKDSEIKLVVSLGAQIYTPDIEGMTKSDAQDELESVDLNLSVESYKYSESVSKGKIISQSVEADSEVEKGDTIYVVVSKGKKLFKVPNVKGDSESKAKNKLKKARLKVSVVKAYNSSVSKGKVIKQSKKAGKRVKEKTNITITVSLGAKPVPVTTSSSSHSSGGSSGEESDVLDGPFL